MSSSIDPSPGFTAGEKGRIAGHTDLLTMKVGMGARQHAERQLFKIVHPGKSFSGRSGDAL